MGTVEKTRTGKAAWKLYMASIAPVPHPMTSFFATRTSPGALFFCQVCTMMQLFPAEHCLTAWGVESLV